MNEGGIRTSTTARSGLCSLTAARSRSASSTAADHVVAGVLEEPGEAFAQERLVLGDHDPHGSSAVTTVPRAGRAVDAEAAAERGDAVGHAGETRPLGGTRAADAVVADARPPGCRCRAARDRTLEACACLAAFASASLATK